MSRTESIHTHTTTSTVLHRDQIDALQLKEVEHLRKIAKEEVFKPQIVWKKLVFYTLLHFISLYGGFQLFTAAKWMTWAWVVFTWVIAVLGITAGAHRFSSHKCYKANLPLKIIIMLMNCVSYQNDMIDWARDHRCHHKWTDTDADPHNITRGFFFSHIGWMFNKKHPKVKEMGQKLDLSDLYTDPVLRFQRRFYMPLASLCCFVLPTAIPVYFWQEKASVAFLAALFRYCCSLHSIFFVNSVAHTIGYRPYDSTISPTEVIWMTATTLGEGGHNYHHTFPQDYRTSEFHLYKCALFNFTVAFIDFFAKIGWAYDLKTVSQETIDFHVNKHAKKETLDSKKE